MKTPIRNGLSATSNLQPLVKDGLRALEGAHHKHIETDLRPAFADSLDIDTAFRKGHEQENRWDYLLGHKVSGTIVALEPHSANNKELSVVIRKRENSLEHLRPHLKANVGVAEWFLVASGKVDFIPMEKATLRLSQNGIRFVGNRLLRKHLPAGKPASPKSR